VGNFGKAESGVRYFTSDSATLVATTSLPFYNEPKRSHVLFVKAAPGTTFTSWSQHHLLWSESPSGKCAKLHTVKASNNRDQAPQSLYHCLLVHMIVEMVGNRSFTLTTGNVQRSRLRRLKNSVLQGSVLAPILFDIYISDLPTSVSRKYAYADDVAIVHADGDWQSVEGALSKDMVTPGEYLQTWKLKLSTTKTVSAVFYLNNKEAKRELKVHFNNKNLPFCSEPKYLGAGPHKAGCRPGASRKGGPPQSVA